MSAKTDNISTMLGDYGLSPEEASVYLYILKKSKTTALAISRNLHIGRTKVYRILDTLYKNNLIEQVLGDRGLLFESKPLENLNTYVLQKELEVQKLKSDLPLILKNLSAITGQTSETDECRVVYYKGAEGLEQVTWNSTKTDELLIFEILDMKVFLAESFAERSLQEFTKNNAKVRQLTNLKKFGGFTKNEDFVKDFWTVRYVDPKLLTIAVETLVYNDIVCFYHTDKNQPFCVEIHNKRLAQMQRQLFNYVWKNAKPMKLLNSRGASSI